MPEFRPVTYKMEEGKARQTEEERLERRRTLSRFGIEFIDEGGGRALKVFHLRLSSASLGLSGLLDMALVKEKEVIPVDFKDGSFSRGPIVALHHKYQLVAYGLLLEEAYGRKAEKGFIYSLEDKRTKSVFFSEGAKMFLKGKLRKIRDMVLTERLPEETPYRGRCRECEFSPVCRG